MKVTADTITDEQIRELQRELLAESPRFNDTAWDIRSTAHALGTSMFFEGIDCRIPTGHEARYVRDARERCAKIWNARHGVKP